MDPVSGGVIVGIFIFVGCLLLAACRKTRDAPLPTPPPFDMEIIQEAASA
jgi:nitrous oxide reductase accessory protein NosL